MHQEATSPMRQPLFRLLFANAMAGALGAAVVVAGLVLTDVGAIGTMLLSSEAPLVPLLLMTAGFTVTFSSAAMGVAVMRLGRPENRSRGGGGHSAKAAPVPVRLR